MLKPRVLVLDVLLHSTLVPRRQRVVEHHELIFHICALVQLDALDDNVVDQVLDTPYRLGLRPG